MYDVAVVGGGPAGASLGRILAARGCATVVLEAARLPRYKPCGGGLTTRALRVLPAEALPMVRLRCTGACAVWAGRQLRVHSQRAVVAMVMRDEFDACLLSLARAAGAEVRDACPVTAVQALPDGVALVAGGERVRARYLACADGASGPFAGPLGRAVGLGGPPPRIGALEVEVEDPQRSWGNELRGDFDLVPGGYGWVFPKDGVLSIGVASWRPGIGGRVLSAALERYLSRLGLTARPVLRRHGHPIPVGGRVPVAQLIGPRALRLGDAAGLADPLFGEGIAHAMESAALAADALLAGDIAAYGRAVANRLYPGFAVAGRLARLFYPHPAPWFALLGMLPALANKAYHAALGGVVHAPAL